VSVARVAESLRGKVAELLATMQTGEALPAGWKLEEWETEEGIRLLFRGGPRAVAIELEAADPSRPCFATTRRFNVYYSLHDRKESRLDPGERALIERVVAILRDREVRLPIAEAASEEASRRIAIREIEVDRALVREKPGMYYLNPYVGCMLACPYCYAIHRADFSRSLEGLPRAEWGRWVDVKANAPEVLAAELARLPPGTVRMSPIVTDPYQPIERKYRITRRCIEAMAGTDFTPIVLTRSSLVLEDLNLLRSCKNVLVGASIPTDDDAVREAFEPGTESIDARVAMLGALREAGLTTFAIVQPMLPLDPERLVDKLSKVARAVRIGPMFEKQRTAEVFQKLGRPDAASEGWERATFEDLKRRFEQKGVPVNPTFPPWSLFL
jgi:DNA repair photolyase